MTFWSSPAQFLYQAVDTTPSPAVALRESCVLVSPGGTALREAASLAPVQGSVWLAKLISADVQGSSGYYPADVLRRDGPFVFPAGTHIYLDHPGRFAEEDLPERSVKDLAGVLMEDARYQDGPDGPGLYSPVRIFATHADEVAAKADHIGMSIRAQGLMDLDAETGRGVVTKLLRADSVDIVTRPGAGGRLIEQLTRSTG